MELQETLESLVDLEHIISNAIDQNDNVAHELRISPEEVAEWLRRAIFLMIELAKETR